MLSSPGRPPLPTGGEGEEALVAAQRALELALRDPAAALRAADELLARRPGPHAAAVAHRAAGLALADIERLPEAVRRFRTAIALAERNGLRRPAAQARMSLAVALAGLGRLPAAMRELDLAARTTRGVDAAEVLAQRALLLGRAGRYTESMAAYARALPVLRRRGNLRFEALALLNRGALRAMHGDLSAAGTDLRRCAQLARAAGMDQLLADAENNLGYVAGCAGDVPAALRAFARAEQAPGIGPGQLAATWTDRATVLLRVGLAGDAAADAAAAVALLEKTGHELDAASGRVLLAEALLADGDATSAATLAAATAEELRRRHRPGWAQSARNLELLARTMAAPSAAGLLRSVRANASAAQDFGGPTAREAQLLLARVLIARGRADDAAPLLDELGADRRAPAGTRVATWTARALMHHQKADDRATRHAIRTGLRLATEYAAVLGASELRAAAAADGRELAELGVRLALRTGDPAQVLTAAEVLRGRSLDRPPTRPPGDAALAADLGALRRVGAELALEREAGSSGLRAEQLRLERAVRDRVLSAPLDPDARPEALDLRSLAAHLGGRALISYVRSEDALHAVALVRGALTLHHLGPWSPIAQEIASARFSAHRLWRAQGSVVSLAAALAALEHSAGRLDALLLAPLPVDDQSLLIAPTADLHALPWGLLPSTSRRPVQVVPSLTWWQHRASRPSRAGGRTLLAAGPGPAHAGPEIRAIAERRPDASILTGRAATVEAVLAGLDGADLVHIACHGRFRVDHPDFSSLQMADGPLYVHDLHRVRRAPRVVVLSACEAARSAVHPGDELMGLAAALLARGTRTLIAPVTAVPDRAARELMIELHRRLADGEAPAVALAQASADTSVVGFTCFGDR